MSEGNGLYSLNAVEAKIREGRYLALAGSEALLSQLPRGNWIGGVCKRFSARGGARVETERLYVYDFSDYISHADIETYQSFVFEGMPYPMGPDGFTYIIIPAFSLAHRAFSMYTATEIERLQSPLVGWVAGVDLGCASMREALVYHGPTASSMPDRLVAMHCTLKPKYSSIIELINPFEPGDGDSIVFPNASFVVQECLVNGVEVNFAQYWRDTHPNPLFPLVANVRGMRVNVHPIQTNGRNSITMAASVIPGIEYKLARPRTDIVDYYRQLVDLVEPGHLFSMHCDANYQLMGLEGKELGRMEGAFTYGEIAYVLMNQTTVSLRIERQS